MFIECLELAIEFWILKYVLFIYMLKSHRNSYGML